MLNRPNYQLREGALEVSGRRKLHGNLYFTTLRFSPGSDGSVREQIRHRRIETFTGRPARGSVATVLADMANNTSDTICAWLNANPAAFMAPTTALREPALV